MAEKRVIEWRKEGEPKRHTLQKRKRKRTGMQQNANRLPRESDVLNTSTTSSIQAENYSDAATDNFNILNLFTEQVRKYII